ncbi:MAG: glutathione S-transferase N-terminal domain-containing protein [Coriobacteriia bacterium]|nr:glutathione S-transferase N-terminal domain-containing protein [Coriobacteriia bacterium]
MELFYFPECPFCNKVRAYMAAHDIELPLLNAHEPENEACLIELGGMRQVPALLHDGEILYESDDIIAYLDAL